MHEKSSRIPLITSSSWEIFFMNDVIADLEKTFKFDSRSLDSRSKDKKIRHLLRITVRTVHTTRNHRKQTDAWKKFKNLNHRFVIMRKFSQLLLHTGINISSMLYVTDRLIQGWQDTPSTLSEKTVADPVKKTLMTLLCLVLFARDASGHCWRQYVVASIRRKKEQRTHSLLLKQIRVNSEFGCHDKSWLTGRKDVTDSWTHHSFLRRRRPSFRSMGTTNFPTPSYSNL